MTIIEQSIVGKKNQQECEDGIAVNDRFAAIIDGSTSKTPLKISEKTSNGRYCMELIRQFICDMPSDISLEGFCSEITKLIQARYRELHADLERLKKNPIERLTASAIIFSDYYKQIWMIGDCQCMVGNAYYDNPKPQEKVLAEKRARYLHSVIKNDDDINDMQTVDKGRKYILNDLIESCNGQNITYAVIDGFDIPLDKIRVINVEDEKQDIVLASDGYPVLKPTLDDSEKALSAQLTSDPLCINAFKATKGLMKGNKSFDDRSYIRLKLTV